MKRILLVDDDAVIALAESMTIKEFGYEVIRSGSGEMAIELVAGESGIDLVLMDIDLGKGIDGLEAARRILGSRHLPIVFLTSHSGSSYIERAREITRYGYVIKGSSDLVLRSSIEIALDLFEAQERLRSEMESRRRCEDSMKAREERCSRIIQRVADSVYTVYYEDERVAKISYNPRCLAVTGFSDREFDADPDLWYKLIVPEDRARVEKHAARLLINEDIESIEYRIIRKDGELRWIRNTSVFNYGSRGELVYRDGIVIDVTERKTAEERMKSLLEEKEMLLSETHRSIKNNMASLASLLSLQADSSDQPTAKALKAAEGRVRSIQVLYDKLFHNKGAGRIILVKEYFEELIDDIRSSYCPECGVKIALDADDALLDADRLFPVGILTNELITNSIKHAFPGRKDGNIRVSFRAPVSGNCVLSVSDDGIGLPSTEKVRESTGLGHSLLDVLAKELNGNVKTIREPGATISVSFPPAGARGRQRLAISPAH
jgi:PAS domain S-box-containing protein